MFDANAGHIQIGQTFFAEVHSTDEQLQKLGVKRGMILLCKHVEKAGERLRENVHSKIKLSKEGEWLDIYDKDRGEGWSWLVYSGRPNGNGFICEKWKAKALEFMNNSWEDNYGGN
ncbi:hypothetical protein HWC21_gp071 [Vibrio phage VAP7]|uniref:Uncharacterized protein n=1 Tax=Vibrio phage VAP7 TaxID=2584487 RepID=A0A4Y5TV65_9CAUD|nr:hypothetical protein HWC21_gp071 [Vibrio phage VAP7]QDB73253.1 hypothetical protein [Vibrio phage VAP7]